MPWLRAVGCDSFLRASMLQGPVLGTDQRVGQGMVYRKVPFSGDREALLSAAMLES